MAGTLTEKTSLVFKKSTVRELRDISEMISCLNDGDSNPKNSELIRFAVYKFIDEVLYHEGPCKYSEEELSVLEYITKARDVNVMGFKTIGG